MVMEKKKGIAKEKEKGPEVPQIVEEVVVNENDKETRSEAGSVQIHPDDFREGEMDPDEVWQAEVSAIESIEERQEQIQAYKDQVEENKKLAELSREFTEWNVSQVEKEGNWHSVCSRKSRWEF